MVVADVAAVEVMWPRGAIAAVGRLGSGASRPQSALRAGAAGAVLMVESVLLVGVVLLRTVVLPALVGLCNHALVTMVMLVAVVLWGGGAGQAALPAAPPLFSVLEVTPWLT